MGEGRKGEGEGKGEGEEERESQAGSVPTQGLDPMTLRS